MAVSVECHYFQGAFPSDPLTGVVYPCTPRVIVLRLPLRPCTHSHICLWACPALQTRSVAAGFGRYGMPPPASNDTGTALGQDCSDWSRDLATLIFDIGGHGACGWCGSSSSIHTPSLKFVGLAIRKIWHTMCVSINGPGDLELWPFDLKTGMRVTSKVGNLPSKFGHARPLGSWIIRSVCNRRTDRQIDGLIAPFPMGGA